MQTLQISQNTLGGSKFDLVLQPPMVNGQGWFVTMTKNGQIIEMPLEMFRVIATMVLAFDPNQL